MRRSIGGNSKFTPPSSVFAHATLRMHCNCHQWIKRSQNVATFEEETRNSRELGWGLKCQRWQFRATYEDRMPQNRDWKKKSERPQQAAGGDCTYLDHANCWIRLESDCRSKQCSQLTRAYFCICAERSPKHWQRQTSGNVLCRIDTLRRESQCISVNSFAWNFRQREPTCLGQHRQSLKSPYMWPSWPQQIDTIWITSSLHE
jgi:hypothetical protein